MLWTARKNKDFSFCGCGGYSGLKQIPNTKVHVPYVEKKFNVIAILTSAVNCFRLDQPAKPGVFKGFCRKYFAKEPRSAFDDLSEVIDTGEDAEWYHFNW